MQGVAQSGNLSASADRASVRSGQSRVASARAPGPPQLTVSWCGLDDPEFAAVATAVRRTSTRRRTNRACTRRRPDFETGSMGAVERPTPAQHAPHPIVATAKADPLAVVSNARAVCRRGARTLSSACPTLRPTASPTLTFVLTSQLRKFLRPHVAEMPRAVMASGVPPCPPQTPGDSRAVEAALSNRSAGMSHQAPRSVTRLPQLVGTDHAGRPT